MRSKAWDSLVAGFSFLLFLLVLFFAVITSPHSQEMNSFQMLEPSMSLTGSQPTANSPTLEQSFLDMRSLIDSWGMDSELQLKQLQELQAIADEQSFFLMESKKRYDLLAFSVETERSAWDRERRLLEQKAARILKENFILKAACGILIGISLTSLVIAVF